jgi:hypothetical protein
VVRDTGGGDLKKKILENFLVRTGSYYARGLNHEKQDFHGLLQLSPIYESLGVRLEYSARGLDGVLYHAEQATISSDDNGALAMWILSTSDPVMRKYEFRERQQTSDSMEKTSYVFGFNDPEDLTKYRVETYLEFWQSGEISYRHAWAMPGETLVFKSAAEKMRHIDDVTAEKRSQLKEI